MMIEAFFLDKTTSTIFFLKSELRNIKKGTMIMIEYKQKVKPIGDILDAIGEDESDHNLVITIVLDLLEKYQ